MRGAVVGERAEHRVAKEHEPVFHHRCAGLLRSLEGYLSRYAEHKQAKQKLNEIAAKLDNCLVIHYSCESFYDIENDRTPRITSIAIMDLQSGQVTSFSIHKVAEKKQG